LHRCEAVLSGYLGDAAVARAIINVVNKVRRAAPNALYCCDPVMGDVGRGFYVKPDIPDMFKNELIPLADIITPNQFELEALTVVTINNIRDARRAIDLIHEKGPRIVLVTSFRSGTGGGQIEMLASDKNGTYIITTPELPIAVGMAGSGDLTASVFLSRYLETGDIKKTLELCTASIFGIIEESWQEHNTGKVKPQLLELRIIQMQKEIDSPSRFFQARKL
jgi:pyridoxine kinase